MTKKDTIIEKLADLEHARKVLEILKDSNK